MKSKGKNTNLSAEHCGVVYLLAQRSDLRGWKSNAAFTRYQKNHKHKSQSQESDINGLSGHILLGNRGHFDTQVSKLDEQKPLNMDIACDC